MGKHRVKKILSFFLTLRAYGFGFSERNLVNLASPKIKPKIFLNSCTTLISKINNDEKMFYIIKDAYRIILEAVSAGDDDIKPVGSESDTFAMIEAFGVAYPPEWDLTDAQAKPYAFAVLKANFASTLAQVNAFDDITDPIWTAINTTLNALVVERRSQEDFYSSLASVVYSLCRQGGYTPSSATKLIEDLSRQHALTFRITQAGASGYWSCLGSTYNRELIQHVMNKILPYFKESIRLTNLVRFAKERGLTMYYQVKQALASFPDFDWALVYSSARTDFENYIAARNLVRDRDYYGYNPDIGIAAATNYPTLAYVCWKLNEIVGGQSTLNYTRSHVSEMVNTQRWERVIRDYRNKLEGVTLSEQARAQANVAFQSLNPGLFTSFDAEGRAVFYEPAPDHPDHPTDDDQSSSSSDEGRGPRGGGAGRSALTNKRCWNSNDSLTLA